MKTLLAAIMMLAFTTATADWENVFQNPDLSINYERHSTVSTVTVDPVQESYPGNSDLFAGDKAGDVMNSDYSPTSLDYFSRGNPDVDCGCI